MVKDFAAETSAVETSALALEHPGSHKEPGDHLEKTVETFAVKTFAVGTSAV